VHVFEKDADGQYMQASKLVVSHLLVKSMCSAALLLLDMILTTSNS